MSLQPIKTSANLSVTPSENSSNSLPPTYIIIGTLATLGIFRFTRNWVQQKTYEYALRKWVDQPSELTQFESQEDLDSPGKLRIQARNRVLEFNRFHSSRSRFLVDLSNEPNGPSYLNLGELKLKSLPPIKEPEKIYTLQASDNCFSSTISLNQFPCLQTLYLSNACKKFSGSLESLKELQLVDLSHNRIRKFPLISPDMRQDFVLKLNHNKIKKIPDYVLQWPKNYTVDLRGNSLSQESIEAIILALKKSTGPSFLFNDISRNYANQRLKNPHSILFNKQPASGIIDFRNNYFSEIPPHFLTLPRTCFIDLRGNPLTKETKNAIKEFLRNRNKSENPSGPEILFDFYRRPYFPNSTWSQTPLSISQFLAEIKIQAIRDQ
jgi:hypothetical protein